MTEAHSGPLAARAWPTPSQSRPNVRYAPDWAVSVVAGVRLRA
jgi:hypothetical protein